MTELHRRVCVPCQTGVRPASVEETCALAVALEGWSVVENHHLEKEWTFPDFAAALAFVNAAGQIAEAQGHHPELLCAWGRARVRIWTYKVDGLTESDFILAARIDQIGRSDASPPPV
jgi:4a-hydroxytetrahydrobiopterin dehydratase